MTNAIVKKYLGQPPIEQRLEDWLYNELETQLARCTEAQRTVFGKVYPDGVRGNGFDFLDVIGAISLVERTIAKTNRDSLSVPGEDKV